MSEYLDYNDLQRYSELLQRQISYIPTETGTSGQILTSSGTGSPVQKTGESIHVSHSALGAALDSTKQIDALFV